MKVYLFAAVPVKDYFIKLQQLRRLCCAKPYPAKHTILDMVGRTYPNSPQKHVLATASAIEHYIQQHDLSCNLANQNQHAN